MSLEKITKYVEQIKVLEKELEQDKQIESTELNNQSDSYKAETYKIADSIEKLSSQIKMVEDEIACNIQDAYIDKAYAELVSEMKFWGVNKPAHKSTNSLQTLEERLKNLLIEKKHLECDGQNKINESDSKIVSSIHTRHDEHKRKINDQIGQIISELKKEYNCLMQKSVCDYSVGAIPQNQNEIPKEIGIGNILLQTPDVMLKYGITNDKNLKLPYFIDIRESGNIVIDTGATDTFNSEIENIVLGMTMKYFESFPANSVKLGVFSSRYSSWQKLNAFYSAASSFKMTIRRNASTNQYDMGQLLTVIEERSDETKDKLWEDGSHDIHELYEKGVSSQSFQLIVLHDVFKDISEENLNRLHGCVVSGQECGVNFLIIDDFSVERFKNKSVEFMGTLSDICTHCRSFKLFGKDIKDTNNNLVNLVSISDKITSQEVYAFSKKYCQYYEQRKKEVVTYEKIGFGTYVNSKAVYDPISIPVATDDLNVWDIGFSYKDDMPLANLIIGVPGTGKSSLIDAMIINGAMKYSPDELVFHLLDFKDGVSSSAYADQCAIPHVKVVSTNNKPEEAEIILDNIITESDRRNGLFKSISILNKSPIKNIAEYNALIDNKKFDYEKLPKLVVVIDECQYLFADEKLSAKCADIIKKCRSQGIHLVFATQTISGSAWKTLQFANGRYCFDVVQEDADRVLSKKYASLVSSEVPKGSYMAYASNNNGDDCKKIKIAYDCGKMAEYAEKIRQRWANYEVVVANVGDKSALTIYDYDQSKLFARGNFAIPLGEDYEDHSLVTVKFDGEKQSSMVLVGPDQRNIDNILISTVMCANSNDIETYIVDASKTKQLTKISSELRHSQVCQTVSGADYMDALAFIYNVYRDRNPEINHKPIYFIINAAQNIEAITDNLKLKFEKTIIPDGFPKAEDYDSDDDYQDAIDMYQVDHPEIKTETVTEVIQAQETLIELVGRGYSRGIFVCLSTDSLSSFDYRSVGVLTSSNYTFITYDALPAVQDAIIKDRIGVGKYNSINENMILLNYMHKHYYRFRVINY